MIDKPTFEIPQAVRDMAEKNIEQTRAAYAQFQQMAQKAQGMMVQSSGAMMDAAREVQQRSMRFAEENIEHSFRFASDLARARDVKEYLEIQTRYAQRQMQTYTEQARELGELMSEAARKAQPKG
ncbi:MAG: phasin family protein [Hyphomicrobiaceae bacterium]